MSKNPATFSGQLRLYPPRAPQIWAKLMYLRPLQFTLGGEGRHSSDLRTRPSRSYARTAFD
jgi:hypothetical protein